MSTEEWGIVLETLDINSPFEGFTIQGTAEKYVDTVIHVFIK